MRVAIVGAGISGLSCAARLIETGHEVELFDKARKPGGRLSTRRREGFAFDHGAQYFTVRDERFGEAVQSLETRGFVAEWSGRIVALQAGAVDEVGDSVRRLVGTPGMSAVARGLTPDCPIHAATRIRGVERAGDGWTLRSEMGEARSGFDAAVIAVPSAQAAPLLDPAPALADRATSCEMKATWALMLAFAGPLDLDFDAAFVNDSPVSWISRNSSKPGRSGGETWVIHGAHAWSEKHVEREPDWVQAQLTAALVEQGLEVPEPSFSDLHRWRYAAPLDPLPEPCLWDPNLRIGACGDWCGGPRVEGAFLSGLAMAARIGP